MGQLHDGISTGNDGRTPQTLFENKLIRKWRGTEGRTKIVDKTNVITLHHNTSRDEDAPKDSLGVELDALAEGHLALLVSGGTGMLDDVTVRLAGVRAVEPGRLIPGQVNSGRSIGRRLWRRGLGRGWRHLVLVVGHGFLFLVKFVMDGRT